MSQPGRRPGTAVGDEQHVLQVLWSMKDILTLWGGPWVCAVSALVSSSNRCTEKSLGVLHSTMCIKDIKYRFLIIYLISISFFN